MLFLTYSQDEDCDEDEEEIDPISSPPFIGAFPPGKHLCAYYEAKQ